MKKINSLPAILFFGMWFSTMAYALPFNIVANSTLPTLALPGATTPPTISYTITNTSRLNPPSISIKFLPPNTSVNTAGTTCTPATGFHLAPGQSCVLSLNITGGINRNDGNQFSHLMVCMSDNVTCAGPAPNYSLNVASTASWISSLANSGFHPVQGNVFLLQNSVCPLFVSIFDSCFGQNPAAPYVVPQPPIEDSYVDPFYATQLETPGPGGTTDIFYRLSDNDALITIVSYPPLAAYVGFQSYVFSRQISNYIGITPPRAPTVSPDTTRYEIVGSVGNDINNIITQSQYGFPWGGNVVVFITTSNTNLANALIANAVAAGISRNSIFIEPVGSNVITGNGVAADDMITLMRFAIPQDTAAGNLWNAQVSQNVAVYKVTNPNISVSRFGMNQYTPHQINNNESALSTALSQLIALLQSYLTTQQAVPSSNQPTVATTVVNSSGVPISGLVGSFCIAVGTNCEADNQDTSTYTNLLLTTLGLEETAFIVGVNHSLANINNNRYVSVDIYSAATSSGIASTSQTNPTAVGFNSGNLTGSAQQILTELGISIPGGDTALLANINNLYVTFIARDCNNPTIAAANNFCINLMGTSLVPAGFPLSVTERSYVLPGTTTGANPDDMVYPFVVAATHDF